MSKITYVGGYKEYSENQVLIDNENELGNIKPCIEGSQAIDYVSKNLYDRVAGKKWAKWGTDEEFDAQ